MSKHSMNRRDLIRLGAGAMAAGAAKVTVLEPLSLWASPRAVPPSDVVRFGIVGTGVEGCTLLKATLSVPGVECSNILGASHFSPFAQASSYILK